MSNICLLRLYNRKPLYETIGQIGTPDLCKSQASQEVLDNNTNYYQGTCCPSEPFMV